MATNGRKVGMTSNYHAAYDLGYGNLVGLDRLEYDKESITLEYGYILGRARGRPRFGSPIERRQAS
ncbi:hypothetical protein J31TS4_18580 [Paenibacillus sp. J31TS4]|nr:hypothetical protein J31TS4_18580 [Paenibacillus sp. J31TS4]